MNNFSRFSNMETLRKKEKLNDTLFIYSKGAEDRSYTVFDKYIDLISPQSIIMFDSRLRNESLSSDEMTKYNNIEQIAKDKDIKSIKTISVENTNLGSYLIHEGITEDSSVSVDISSMNFWELSDLIYFLLKIICVKKIHLFYTEPDLYHYENDNISQYNHNIPNVSVKYIRSYYSTKTLDDEILVSIIGFQKNVSKLMKDIIEVSQYYSINGFPSFYPKAKDISQSINSDYLAEIDPANRFSSEATNPFITFNTLVDINKASKGAFMNICPLSSKPMAVGACLYALRYPDSTRIVYPYEETVTTKADGVGRTYCYTIMSEFIS